MRKIQIMVTGASGYIGSNIVCRLLKNNEEIQIIAAVRDEDQARTLGALFQNNPRVNFRYGTMPEKPWDMQGIDVLIHCAGLLVGGNLSALFKINVNGTKNILEEAKRHHVKRVIYLSSQSVYGANRPVLYEDMPAQPASLYASSKFAAELICLEKEFEDLQTIILRCARVYGKGLLMRRELLPHYYARMTAKEEALPLFIHTQNGMNYIHISDLGEAVFKAATKDGLPQKLTMNIGSTVTITNVELVAICQEAAEWCKLEKPSLKLIPKGSNMNASAVMNIERAQRYLDWSQETTMLAGMIELIESEIET